MTSAPPSLARPTGSAPRAAYVHVPFCRHRCGYCNFALVAGRDDLIEGYLAALAEELRWLGGPHPVDTLFLGGGTPTHLPPGQLERLLTLVTEAFPLAADGGRAEVEFSVEANPSDLDAARVETLARRGVNRVSLGAQSFDRGKLALLERDHSADVIAAAWERLRPHMRSLSLDLIFATPGESPAMWASDLAAAIALAPDHVSTYGLTIERGTRFYARQAHGELCELDEAIWAEMYASAIDQLTAAGVEHYEVSNFARAGHRCRHNEVYWSGEEYFAAGPGAARYVGGTRQVNHKSTTAYIRRVLAGQSPVAESETLAPEDRAREALVIGLRRMAGIELDAFAARFGHRPEQLGGAALERFVAEGLLAVETGRLRLTRKGLLVSDALWPAFLRR